MFYTEDGEFLPGRLSARSLTRANGINYRRVINPRADTLSFRLAAGNLFRHVARLHPCEKIEDRKGNRACARARITGGLKAKIIM